MKDKNKISVKMSDVNLTFWDKMDINYTVRYKEKLRKITHRSDLQEVVVTFFKLNNDRYLELLELLKNMEANKNGTK